MKVPVYAMKQADCPYLEFSYETNIVNVLDRYPDLYDQFYKGGNLKVQAATGAYETYEQWARLFLSIEMKYLKILSPVGISGLDLVLTISFLKMIEMNFSNDSLTE